MLAHLEKLRLLCELLDSLLMPVDQLAIASDPFKGILAGCLGVIALLKGCLSCLLKLFGTNHQYGDLSLTF